MSRARVVVAWVLVALWVVVTVVGVRDASRESSYATFLALVRGGEVTEVTVVGDVTTPRTVATVELRWDGGIVDGSTRVTAAQPLGMAERAGIRSRVLPAPVADTLREEFPDLTVRSAEERAPLSGWWTWLGFTGFIGTIALLGTTRRPLRATQWGWFWLFWILPPVGLVAFLLLGGPTGLVPQREGGRRLTGGWAFSLSLVLGGPTLVAALAA